MKKLIPLLVICLLVLLFYLLGLQHHFTVHALKGYHESFKAFASAHPLLGPLAYMGVFTLAIALSLPLLTELSLVGGLLFPEPLSLIYAVFSATLGATLIFLIARLAFRGLLHKKSPAFLRKMEKGFNAHEISYLLFLRLAHFSPFSLVNLAAGFFNVRGRTFVWTTFVGIIPICFIYTQAGADLAIVLQQGGKFSLHEILNTPTKIALLAAGCLALLPILLKKK